MGRCNTRETLRESPPTTNLVFSRVRGYFNESGICYIADVFGIQGTEVLFVGDKEKDF